MTDEKKETTCEVEVFDSERLKNPLLAAVFAWLVPGLGHWYQGRKPKAVLFFTCIMSIFLFGCYMGSDREYGPARVVYSCWNWDKGEQRLFFIPQAFIGIAAIPAYLQARRVEQGYPPLFYGFMAPPNSRDANLPEGNPTFNQLISRLHRYFEVGTIYTVIAGFMNILVVFDAISGPVFERDSKKESKNNVDKTNEEKGA